MAAAGRAVADVENRARDAIESDSRVLDLMGGRVEVGPPMSQSSMSSSVNGRVTKQVCPPQMPLCSSGTQCIYASAT